MNLVVAVAAVSLCPHLVGPAEVGLNEEDLHAVEVRPRMTAGGYRSLRVGESPPTSASASLRRRNRPPKGVLSRFVSDTLPLNVSSPTKWGRWTAAIAAGRRGLPSKESTKERLTQPPPQSGFAGQLPQRESTRERVRRYRRCRVYRANRHPKGGPTRRNPRSIEVSGLSRKPTP